jgi:hypothetical protein
VSAVHKNEVSDPALAAAAELLRDLPVEKPPVDLSALVTEQVRPLAVRRKRFMRALISAALVAAMAYGVMLMWVLLSEGSP